MKQTKPNGQALVEAVGTVWLLFLLFVGLYFLFIAAIEKLRSLDKAYHQARAAQVRLATSIWPIATPNPHFLDRSWPGARVDEPVRMAVLAREILTLEAKARAGL